MLKNWLEDLSSSVNDVRVRYNGNTVSSENGTTALVDLLEEAIAQDKALWIIGNGGSSSIIAHMSQDFMGKLGIRSQALTDASLLTCIANDFGYENVYARPLGIMGREGDILVAISSSGNSDNIVNAVDKAVELGMHPVTLSGFGEDNRLFATQTGLNFYVPSDNYGTVEVGHLAILHAALDHMVAQKNVNQDQTKIRAL